MFRKRGLCMIESWLFELSWEVCNKVGGIYTVIKSKLASAAAIVQDYAAIGPYFPDKHASEFVEEDAPPQFAAVFEKLRGEGIFCHYGKWLADI